MKFHEIFIRYVSWQDSWRNSSHLYSLSWVTWLECELFGCVRFTKCVSETQRVDVCQGKCSNPTWNILKHTNIHSYESYDFVNQKHIGSYSMSKMRIAKSELYRPKASTIHMQCKRSETMFSIFDCGSEWTSQQLTESGLRVLVFAVHQAFYVILNVPSNNET